MCGLTHAYVYLKHVKYTDEGFYEISHFPYTLQHEIVNILPKPI